MIYFRSLVRCFAVFLCSLWTQTAGAETPDWFDASGSFRARYQSFDNQLRPGLAQDSTVFTLRTLVHLQIKPSSALTFGAEFQDSRVLDDAPGAGLSTAIVNSAELLRAYASLKMTDSFADGDESLLSVGRLTLDQGRRRFIARNRFRNTINAFTGILYQWESADKAHDIEAFWFLPVERQPRAQADLARNAVQFDNESFGQQFWGLYYETSALPLGLTGNAFLYGLHERDSDKRQTRNRQIYTPGFALYHLSNPGEWFFDSEAAINIGTARVSTAEADTQDLDQFGYFVHLEAGYHFASKWSPKLLLQFEIASGDDNPNDDKLGNFDTLFGPRRADFGPTDIYGALARSNIIAAGAALHLTPSAKSNIQFRYLPAWLENSRAEWATVGLVDPTGASGSFLGHQLETRFHYDLIPKKVRVGGGGAYFIKGSFAKQAPNATDFGDAAYFYADVTFSF